MAQLAAEGVLDTPHIPDLSSAQPEQAPAAEEAIGGRVTIHFAGVGVWCRGEVLAYSAAKQVCVRDGACPRSLALHRAFSSHECCKQFPLSISFSWRADVHAGSGCACRLCAVHLSTSQLL